MHPSALAFVIGVVSSISFPVGAVLGLVIELSQRTLSILLAFGAGSLLFALTIELFGPPLYEYKSDNPTAIERYAVFSSFIGGFLGALLFVFLNSLLETDDGPGTEKVPRTRIHDTMNSTSRVSAVPSAQGATYSQPLFQHRELGEYAPPGPGQRNGVFSKDFEQIGTGPVNNNNTSFIERLAGGKAAMSMWLGVMLDGIPESMVFGFLADRGKFSVSLVFGVFVSNFPEAITAAAMMKEAGRSNIAIIAMWSSLVIVTGMGATITTWIFSRETNHESLMMVIITHSSEGLAAGAMLAMVSSTMLPEAFHKGNQKIVSMMSVCGFLAAFMISAFTGT